MKINKNLEKKKELINASKLSYKKWV